MRCPAARCSAWPSRGALVIEPEAVLCDEPTGNLDSANSEEVLRLLRSLPEPGRRAVVMVTHDAHAAAYGDRIVHIRDGLVESEEAVAGKSEIRISKSETNSKPEITMVKTPPPASSF